MKDVQEILDHLLQAGDVRQFSDRIRMIRGSTELSRAGFAKKVGVAAATMDGVENKDRTPRGDLLEKIVIEYPHYGMFLITGTHGFTIPQVAPLEKNVKNRAFEFIDEVDARYMSECIVKPECFKNLHLVQSTKNENDLAAIITVTKEVSTGRGDITRAIWIKAGNINFASKHGGKIALEALRDWIKTNAPDLLITAELKSINAGMLDVVPLNRSLSRSFISEMDESKEINRLLMASFMDWKSGKKDW
jgi:transcriptional regulator with XRE-family HTH domain